MTLFKKASISLTILLACVVIWLFSVQQQNDSAIAEEDSSLKIAVNSCQGITERAAAHLVAVVEFQKLEIAGRKAYVFKMCMQDHGYIENNNWLTYSRPIAKGIAKETEVSVDAALESLRRTNMIMIEGEEGQPMYWTLKDVSP